MSEKIAKKHITRRCVSADTGNSRQGDKFTYLVKILEEMRDREFTGQVKINFSQGGIGRIEKFEELLRTSPQAE